MIRPFNRFYPRQPRAFAPWLGLSGAGLEPERSGDRLPKGSPKGGAPATSTESSPCRLRPIRPTTSRPSSRPMSRRFRSGPGKRSPLRPSGGNAVRRKDRHQSIRNSNSMIGASWSLMVNRVRRKSGPFTQPTERQPVSAHGNALFRDQRKQGNAPFCPNFAKNGGICPVHALFGQNS